NEVLDLIQIKPQYLYNEKNKKMLEQLIQTWKKNKIINYQIIAKEHKDFDFEHWIVLFNDTFYYKNSYLQQLKLAEESIVKYYKEDIIKKVNEDLKSNKITYDEF